MAGSGHNPYRRSIRVTAIVTAVCLASVGLGILLTALGVGKSPILFLPIPIALFGILLLPILYFSGRRQGRQIDALLSGGIWRTGRTARTSGGASVTKSGRAPEVRRAGRSSTWLGSARSPA